MKNLIGQSVLALVIVLLVVGIAVSATSKTSKMMPGTMTLAVEPNTEPNKPAEPNKPEQKLVKLAEEPNIEPNTPAEPNAPVTPKKRPRPRA